MYLAELLSLKVNHSDFDKDLTIRGYFKELLLALWKEGEGFSGKRPFGNSGWEYDIYPSLIKAGAIKGSLDEDGYVENIDDDPDAIVLDLINFALQD